MKDTVYKSVINKEALLLKKVDGITDAAAAGLSSLPISSS